MRSFFEYIQHGKLRERGASKGFSKKLMKLALKAYRLPRSICKEGKLAAPLYPDRGVIAGCGFATTMVKIYGIEAFDQFVALWPSATLDTYIDDLTVTEVMNLRQEQTVTDISKRMRLYSTEICACLTKLANIIQDNEESSKFKGFNINFFHTDYLETTMKKIAEARKDSKLISLRHNDIRPADTRVVYLIHRAKLFSDATIARHREEPQSEILRSFNEHTAVSLGKYSLNETTRLEMQEHGEFLTPRQEEIFASKAKKI